jgi:hypothetical protein
MTSDGADQMLLAAWPVITSEAPLTIRVLPLVFSALFFLVLYKREFDPAKPVQILKDIGLLCGVILVFAVLSDLGW